MTANSGGFIRANGIDIHYVQAGQGIPFILLHGGLVSTNPIWAATPVSYAGHMETLARRYRVLPVEDREPKPIARLGSDRQDCSSCLSNPGTSFSIGRGQWLGVRKFQSISSISFAVVTDT